MDAQELRARQAPLKDRYRQDAAAANVVFHSQGAIDPQALTCSVATSRGTVISGLHAAAGGEGNTACSGDLLLDALVACAGVTLAVVATSMGVALRGAAIRAQAASDFRGTLAVDRAVPVGVTDVQLEFQLDSDAPADQLDKLVQLTERYCVILQTLQHPPAVTCRRTIAEGL